MEETSRRAMIIMEQAEENEEFTMIKFVLLRLQKTKGFIGMNPEVRVAHQF